MSLLRRDRYGLSRFDRRGRASNGLYFDEVEASPRARLNPFVDSQAMSRLIRSPFFDEEEVHQHWRSRDYQHERRRSDSLPFGKAMKKLYKQITQAEQFYSDFQNNFDADIQAIQGYATEDILKVLWELKVRGRRSRSRDSQQGSPERGSEKFEIMQRKVAQALEMAVESRVNDWIGRSKKSSPKIDSSKRLQKKVETANDQILDLLHHAAHSREYCEALLSELELLKTLIDPDLDKNKGLYRGGGDEDDESDPQATNNEGANANANEQSREGYY